MSTINEPRLRKLLIHRIKGTGLFNVIQAKYLQQTAKVISEHSNEKLHSLIRVPHNTATNIAREIVLQFLTEFRMFNTLECLRNESLGVFVKKKDDGWSADLVKTHRSRILHQLYKKWMSSNRKLTLRLTPDDDKILQEIMARSRNIESPVFSANENLDVSIRSIEIRKPSKDSHREEHETSTIGPGPTSTAIGDSDSEKRQVKMHTKQPVRNTRNTDNVDTVNHTDKRSGGSGSSKKKNESAELIVIYSSDDEANRNAPAARGSTQKVPFKAGKPGADAQVQVTLSMSSDNVRVRENSSRSDSRTFSENYDYYASSSHKSSTGR